MKTKLIILSAVIAVAIVRGLFLFSGFKNASPKEIAAIDKFMAALSKKLQTPGDSAKVYFDMPQRQTDVDSLVNMLTNPNVLTKGIFPLFSLEISTVSPAKQISDNMFEAELIATLSRDSLPKKVISIPLTLTKIKGGQLKITDFNMGAFNDFIAYQKFVEKQRTSDEAIYSPATLAAFRVAKQLALRGDSIPWFQHEGGETYYFIAKKKGRMCFDRYADEDKPQPLIQIGLYGPSQKVIIPAVYDLVHNIGATFPGLAEVESKHKRGLYNMHGKIVLPVEYDEVFPLSDKTNKAVLRKGDSYYWWKNDGTVGADTTIKIAAILPRIRSVGQSYNIDENNQRHGAEYNSKVMQASIYFPPSYLVDWHLRSAQEDYRNPQRKYVFASGTELSEVKYSGEHSALGWLRAFFYSITDHFIEGREGFYGHKAVVLVNKKRNRIYSQNMDMDYPSEDGGHLAGKCDIYDTHAINDTLYEFKFGSEKSINLYNNAVITAGPSYNYLVLRNDKLVEKPTRRQFGFTKYVKMDDNYLYGCYQTYDDKDKKRTIDALTPEILQYMKNEILADCGHVFKDPKWAEIFDQFAEDKNGNKMKPIEPSAIDKYNIAFIDRKLNELNATKLLAAK